MYGLKAYGTLVHAVCWVELMNGSASPTSLRETHTRLEGLTVKQRGMIVAMPEIRETCAAMRRRTQQHIHGIVVQPLHSMM